LLGVGLQVLGQAFGGKTFKLKFGHHGGNHPIRYMPTGEWLWRLAAPLRAATQDAALYSLRKFLM
jgi:hypothetical protein